MSEGKDIGYKIKAKAKQFDNKNGKVTYTLKELMKAVHEDISELSDDIQGVNDKLNTFMVNEIAEIVEIKTSLKLYKRLTVGMVLSIITLVVMQVIIL